MALLLPEGLTNLPFGLPSLYTGAIRIFVPPGSSGYQGADSCGCSCCDGSACQDARVVLFYQGGELTDVSGYNGQHNLFAPSPDGFYLAGAANAPIQWLPGVKSPEGEADCRCNPSEYWNVPSGTGQTTISGIAATAHKIDPYKTIATLAADIEALKIKLKECNGRLILAIGTTPKPPPVPVPVDPAKSLDEFVEGLSRCD